MSGHDNVAHPQGLFELAGGFGYALGPSLGGVMYQVQTQYS